MLADCRLKCSSRSLHCAVVCMHAFCDHVRDADMVQAGMDHSHLLDGIGASKLQPLSPSRHQSAWCHTYSQRQNAALSDAVQAIKPFPRRWCGCGCNTI